MNGSLLDKEISEIKANQCGMISQFKKLSNNFGNTHLDKLLGAFAKVQMGIRESSCSQSRLKKGKRT